MTQKKIATREVITHHVNNETGEVINSKEQEITAWEKEPPYVKLYLDDLSKLNELNPTEQKLVHELVYNMGYNNVVPSYKPVKQIMAEKIKVKYNTLNEAIKSLHKKGILVRKARGFYIMDPVLFGRGSWQGIKKIRMIVDYNSNGRKVVNTELVKQLELDL